MSKNYFKIKKLEMVDKNINKDFFLEKELLAPYTHLLQAEGKQIRTKIVTAFNHWLKIPKDKMQETVETVNLVYVGSLIIDDIQDNTSVRRGLPASHCVYGVPMTINAGLQVFILALEKTFNIHPKAPEIYKRDFLEIIRGQGSDIYWRENMICPTENQYKEMLKQKTGRMLLMTVSIMQLLSDFKEDLSKLVLLIGLYFQIRDDYCNLICQEELEEWPVNGEQINNSSYCEDIAEGKFSLPVIHSMGTPQAEQILNILRQRTNDNALKKYCVSLLEQSGSLEYTRNVLEKLDHEAREMVSSLGGNPEMDAVLDELLSWK